MTMRWLAAAGGALLLALPSACVSVHRPGFILPAPQRDWPTALDAAQRQAIAGKFGAADSTLAEFALDYPGTPEALETAYWRALFALDPTNQHASVTTAMASLDAYLRDGRPRVHVAEAMTLRHIAAQLESLNRLASSAMAQARDASATAANAKAEASDANARAEAVKSDVTTSNDAEIKRLRDELAKANAELERIKKRLAQPPPKPD
jgi:hypothetical protein